MTFPGAPDVSSFSPLFWVLLRMQEFQMLLVFSIPITGWDFSCCESNVYYLFLYEMGQKSHHSIAE